MNSKEEVLDILEKLAQETVYHTNCQFLNDFRKKYNLTTKNRKLKLLNKYETSYEVIISIDNYSIQSKLKF